MVRLRPFWQRRYRPAPSPPLSTTAEGIGRAIVLRAAELGAALIVAFFGENYGGSSSAEEQEAKRDAGLPAPGKGVAASLQEAVGIIASDKRILLTGLVQALFEGAMYIFVLQWPPAMSAMAGDG